MNERTQQLRDELIEALESGTYKQAQGRLRRGDAFCCLGVACNIHDPSLWNAAETYSLNTYCLTIRVREDYGFYDSDGAPEFDDGPSLVLLNDDGKTFPQIAAELRTGKYWKPL